MTQLLGASILSALIAAGTLTSGLAATPQLARLSWLSIHTVTLEAPPYTFWQPFTASVLIWQRNGEVHGFVYTNDRANNVKIVGNVTVFVAITDGYHFEGCGQAWGSVRGDVCFGGSGKAQPLGSSFDYFALTVSSGGSYSVYGNVPAGSVHYH